VHARGTFFDGATAADHDCELDLTNGGLVLRIAGRPQQIWSYSDLLPVDLPQPGQPFRLSHSGQPGARLTIRDDDFVTALLARAPHLKGGINPHLVAKLVGWIAAGLIIFVALAYLVLTVAPQQIASILPDDWRSRIGEQLEQSLVEGAKVCEAPNGKAALSAMVGRLAEGVTDMPPVSVRVYDIPVMNAFAMPGGRIVVTRKLIETAGSPDEVAGVVAHEIGHVWHRHAETQLVRIMGLQVLMSVATSGSDGGKLGSFAGIATILQYTRNAEREADRFAIATLTRSKIDPTALSNFFETVKKEEGEPMQGVFGRIGNMMSTHPVTQDRMDQIKHLPDGVTPKASLSREQWQALLAICGKPAKMQDQL
jgi:predicted Zn-dependent protease